MEIVGTVLGILFAAAIVVAVLAAYLWSGWRGLVWAAQRGWPLWAAIPAAAIAFAAMPLRVLLSLVRPAPPALPTMVVRRPVSGGEPDLGRGSTPAEQAALRRSHGRD